MNSGKNIKNALHVLYKTYENLEKLMDYTKIVSQEKTDYILSSNKFLRPSKSDIYTTAWLLNDFILLFQNKKDKDCESKNGWKDAPVYVMEIYLGNEKYVEEDIPAIYLSKFEYNDINDLSEGCSPTNHWGFYWPLRNSEYMNFDYMDDKSIAIPKNEKASKTYWDLKKVTTKKLDLFEVTSENLREKIFGTFDELAKIRQTVD